MLIASPICCCWCYYRGMYEAAVEMGIVDEERKFSFSANDNMV